MRWAVCVLVLHLGCRGETKCDVSTNQAATALYARLAPDEAGSNSCVKRARTFVGLVSVGGFANDRGCMYRHVIYGCALDPKGYSARAMAAAGWAAADPANKQVLAIAWLEEVDDQRVLDAAPDDWAKTGKPFAPPTATPDSAGGFALRYWIEAPSGMQRGPTYKQLEVVFDRDGDHGDIKQLDTIHVQ